MVFAVGYLFLKEKPQSGVNLAVLHNAKQQILAILRSKTLWWALVFAGLFYFAPGFQTTLYYVQKDHLHVDDGFVGVLNAMQGAGNVAGAIAYAFLARRINIKWLLAFGIALSAVCALFYLFYANPPAQPMTIEFMYGFSFALAEVCILDMIARSTPRGSEALGFALVVSVTNLTQQGADFLGSKLWDNHWTFSNMVFLNAGTSLVVLVLLPFLQWRLMRMRDR